MILSSLAGFREAKATACIRWTQQSRRWLNIERLALSCIGTDVATGVPRLDFGIGPLKDGIDFVSMAVGLSAVSEVIQNLVKPEERVIIKGRIKNLWPSKTELRQAAPEAANNAGA